MANNLKELDVDVIRKVTKTSSENQIHIVAIKTGEVRKTPQVEQGGIIELEYPPYSGEYEATPTSSDQIFPTKDTSMLDDFTVKATPYSETSTTGTTGYTATIL